jgi:hypothetical protein
MPRTTVTGYRNFHRKPARFTDRSSLAIERRGEESPRSRHRGHDRQWDCKPIHDGPPDSARFIDLVKYDEGPVAAPAENFITGLVNEHSERSGVMPEVVTHQLEPQNSD